MRGKCNGCRYYEGVYVMCLCSFYRKKFGYCSLHREIIPTPQGCGDRKCRVFKKRTVSIENIDRAIGDAERLMKYYSD